MPPTRRKTGEVRVTGLSPDEENLIKDAARYMRKTIRQLVLDHARDVVSEAQIRIDAASREGAEPYNWNDMEAPHV